MFLRKHSKKIEWLRLCGTEFGEGARIMRDVITRNNCIVAVGAIVTKDVPNNSVVGGIPAKVICSVEDYIKEKNL